MKTLRVILRTGALMAFVLTSLNNTYAAEKSLQKANSSGGSVIMQQLKAKGATVVPMTPIMKKFSAGAGGGAKYTCDSLACWCSGGSDCLNLMDNRECKHWRCGNDAGQPVCWCDL